MPFVVGVLSSKYVMIVGNDFADLVVALYLIR